MLPELRNFEFSVWKMIEIRINPTITGRRPVSPERSRTTQARAYSGNVCATISGGTTASRSTSVSTSRSTASLVGASLPTGVLTAPAPGPGSGPTDRM
jgi:hypothetical protein